MQRAGLIHIDPQRGGGFDIPASMDHASFRRWDDHYIELVGTPDIVIEVVSASSTKKDLHTLRAAYARAGIPEYWIIDARGDSIHFVILHLDGAVYREAADAGEPQPSRIFARRFRLTRHRNELGRYSYDLAVVA